MRKPILLLASIFAIATQSMADGYGYANINSYADAFVFDEMGVTFSVYPDGEFDFYLPVNGQATTVSNGYVNVTFNSGYDYNPYVQYDDFGAVIQVENVPVWYDYYGRVSQIGDVHISYRDRRVCQVGGLYVHYNRHGHYAYHTGYINSWNPYFVYRPFYVAFARPAINLCFVHLTPYRQFYTPVRYTYYRPYVQNVRPCFATVGRTYRPSGHGLAHHRYTQTAGRGERPVIRNRRTVTTADASPRPTSVSRNRTSDLQSQGSSAYSRNNSGVKPAANRANPSRTVTSSGSAKPSTVNRQPLSTKPRQVQTAPSRNRTSSGAVSTKPNAVRQPSSTVNRTVKPSSARQPSSAVNRTVKPSSNSVSRGSVSNNSRPVAKPSSSRNQSVSKTQSSSKPSVQRSRSNQSSGRTAVKPQSSSRSSNTSARTSSRNTSSVSKASASNSTSRSASRGSMSKVTSKRRN